MRRLCLLLDGSHAMAASAHSQNAPTAFGSNFVTSLQPVLGAFAAAFLQRNRLAQIAAVRIGGHWGWRDSEEGVVTAAAEKYITE